MGINIADRVAIFSSYLPTRAGCTDAFKESLDLLQMIKSKLDGSTMVVFAGDLNADPGVEGGPCATTTVNEQGRILNQYLKRWGFTSSHLHLNTVSSSHTYEGDHNGCKSTIDHLLCAERFLPQIQSCYVIDNEPSNTSDHLPLYAEINAPIHHTTTPRSQQPKRDNPNWKKLTVKEIKRTYTESLHCKLMDISIPSAEACIEDPQVIHQFLEDLGTAMKSSANENLPKKQFKKHKRPGWNRSINTAQRRSKAAWHRWKQAGHPLDPSHEARAEYLSSKRRFRQAMRKLQKEQDTAFYEDIDLHCSDSSKLFRLLSRRMGTNCELPKTIYVNGVEYAGENVLEGWARHFEDLGSPVIGGFNEAFQDQVRLELAEMDELSEEEVDEVLMSITEDEVRAAIQSLPLQKAAGPDQIQPEHLRYGGDLLVQYVTALFNLIISHEFIPTSFQHGLTVPIPKSSDKDLTNPSNYRGITLLSNVGKLLEKVILQRLHDRTKIDSCMSPLQGGFKPGVSCLHTAMIFQEAIQHIREKGKKAYVALLDVRKAFDTVWHEGLFHKLFQLGVKDHAWRLLRKWYSSSSCSVLWNGVCSTSFNINQGVKQGGVLSPLLYSIYLNDLLIELQQSKLGAKMGEIYCGAPAYADDLALVASSPEELQKMLDIVHAYSNKWRYRLNPSKSKIMIFGAAKPKSLGVNVTLNGQPLEIVEEYTHLGVLRSSGRTTTARTSRQISAARSAFFALNRVGSRFGCIHPITSMRLYSSICLPRMLYGCELWAVTKTEMEMLERSHRKILRTVQGLPLRCPNSGLLAAIGGQSIADLIAIKKLLFVHSITSLPEHSLPIPRQVLTQRLQAPNAKAWLPSILTSSDSLNLPSANDLLQHAPSKPVWKRVVSGIIRARAEMSLLEEAEHKCSLHLLSQMDPRSGSPSTLWTITHNKELLHLTARNNFRIRLVLGCHGLESDAARFRKRRGGLEVGSSTCRLCVQGVEDPTHFLATCPALERR